MSPTSIALPVIVALLPGCYLSHELSAGSGPRRDGGTADGGVSDTMCAPVGRSWSTTTVASSVGSYAAAGDPGCGVHLVYSEGTPGRLVYRLGTGDGWSDEEVVDAEGYVGPTGIAVDRWGNPRIAFVSGDGFLQVAVREEGMWSTEPVEPGASPASIAVDAGGSAHLVYRVPDGSLVYAELSGGAWSAQTIDRRDCYEWAIALTPDGVPHVSYSYVSSPSVHAIIHAMRGGGGWRTEDVETLDGHETGSESAIVAAGGTIHLFYLAYRGLGDQAIRHAETTGGPLRFEWLDTLAPFGLLGGAAAAGPDDSIHLVYQGRDDATMTLPLTYGRLAHGELTSEVIEIDGPAPMPGSGLPAVDGAGNVHLLIYASGTLLDVARGP